MTPQDRIKQLEKELAEEQARRAEHENLLTMQDVIIGTMLQKERAQTPDELRTLTFQERQNQRIFPIITGREKEDHTLNTAQGLEGFGAIRARCERELEAHKKAQQEAEQKAA